MKKILFIGTTNIYGGVGHIMFDYCKLLYREGYQFDFLYYESPSDEEMKMIENYGANFYLMPKYSKKPIEFMKSIKSFYANNEYDIVHIHASTGMLMMYALPIWNSEAVEIVYQSHVDKVDGFFNRILHKCFVPLVNRYSKKKVAVSGIAASHMYGKKSTQAIIINNGIDTEKYAYDEKVREEVRNSLGVTKNQLLVGNVGRFSKQKNNVFLVNVFYEINKIRPDSTLLLVGNGEDEQLVRDEVDRLGISSSVIFYGTSVEVHKLLNAMDVFLFPSLWEGLGITAIESQANGLPVVASNMVPPEAKVTDLFSIMNISDSASEWAKHALSVCKTVDKRNEYYRIVQNSGFSLEQSVKELINLYNLGDEQ